uniref:Proline-rich protein 11 n=1 Tax=Petromyzon marinus TaxID=7757 RepID=A0AAJ7TSU9_PETMA|nr:proline-rich protein 11 [Petromyzon marinus]
MSKSRRRRWKTERTRGRPLGRPTAGRLRQCPAARSPECDGRAHVEGEPCQGGAVAGLSRAVRSLVGTVSHVYHWCSSGILQGVVLAKDWLTPELAYRKDLQQTLRRLTSLEAELQALKRITRDGTHQACEGLCPKCAGVCVPCPPPVCAVPPLVSSSLPPQAPPPPPPPPPLPPPPTAQPRLVLKRKAAVQRPTQRDCTAVVTVKDLLRVKLRKTSTEAEDEKRDASEWKKALVTVRDLQAVSLRRTVSESCAQTMLSPRGCRQTPNKTPYNLRGLLKRVDIIRSPGGTPMYDKENRETGTGLTPIMTQALRKKFKSLHADRSPSPAGKYSPNNSFEDLMQ